MRFGSAAPRRSHLRSATIRVAASAYLPLSVANPHAERQAHYGQLNSDSPPMQSSVPDPP